MKTQWGRAQLGRKGEEGDLYFVGNGDGVDPDAIGRDLALLAACNHTIQGRKKDALKM